MSSSGNASLNKMSFTQQLIAAKTPDETNKIYHAVMDVIDALEQQDESPTEAKTERDLSQIPMPVAAVILSPPCEKSPTQCILFGNDPIAQEIFLQSASGSAFFLASKTLKGNTFANCFVNKVPHKIYNLIEKQTFSSISKEYLSGINIVLLFGNDIEKIRDCINTLETSGIKSKHIVAYDKNAKNVFLLDYEEITLQNLMTLKEMPMTVPKETAIQSSQLLLQKISDALGVQPSQKDKNNCRIM